jgi:hypothetical protein
VDDSCWIYIGESVSNDEISSDITPIIELRVILRGIRGEIGIFLNLSDIDICPDRQTAHTNSYHETG